MANVEEETAKLFRFLGLSVTVPVKEFLNIRTRVSMEPPSCTTRFRQLDSRNQWRPNGELNCLAVILRTSLKFALML